MNWTAVGVQTAVGATTAALGPLAGATVSGIGSIVTDVVKDDDGKITKDELKNITVNAAYSAGFSLIGSGAGEVAKKVGAQQLIDNLYKNNSGKAIKGIVNNFIDIPKGASVNNVKSINWLKNTHVICNGKKITEYQALGNAMMDMKKWVTVGASSVATGYSSLIRTSYDISKKK